MPDFSTLRYLCWSRRMARAGHGTSIRTHQRRIAAERLKLLDAGCDPFIVHAFIMFHTSCRKHAPAVARARKILEKSGLLSVQTWL